MNDYLKKLETAYCTKDCANYKCRINKRKSIKKEDCFYFTGVYCENTHEYECARGHCTCHACFEYMNWWQRFCMRIEVELLQRRIWLDSIFHKRKLFRRKNDNTRRYKKNN